MTEEEYRSIPEHDTIEVSRDGKVRYKDGKKYEIRSVYRSNNNRWCVRYHIDEKRVCVC